jgi:Spy/CpxP family protein refolding chaperone
MNRKGFVLLAAVAIVLLAPLVAQAGPPGPGELLRNPRALARYLKLTPAQVTTYRQLLDQLEAKLKPLRAEQKTLRKDLYDALEAATPNACSIGDIAIDIHEVGEKSKAALHEFDVAFSAILTPEQLAKYEALKEAARHFGDGSEG